MSRIGDRAARLALVLAGLATGCAANVSQMGTRGPVEVWFAPLSPVAGDGSYGSVDYMNLFDLGAPWTTASSRVSVFKVYQGFVDRASDDQLHEVFADLKRRDIALALEQGVVDTDEGCGVGLEGFVRLQDALQTVSRIRQLGGRLRYLAMDEPFYYGSVFDGPSACRWSAAKLASKVAAGIHAIRGVAPEVIVGDIEPVSADLRATASEYSKWVEAYRLVSGEDLSFFHFDVNWQSPAWEKEALELKRRLEERGIPYGMIYNGNGDETSDADWLDDAEAHMVRYESTLHGIPNHAVFQSWNPHPIHLLPESQPNTFTHVIDRYFRERTNLSLTVSGRAAGRLVGSGGAPLSGAAVKLSLRPTTGAGVPAEFSLSGVVPASATSLVVGFRVNQECACQAQSDFVLYQAAYSEGGATNQVPNPDFSQGLQGWSFSGTGTVSLMPSDRGRGQALHIVASRGSGLSFNSGHLTANAGVPYRASFASRVGPTSEGSGYFLVAFFRPGIRRSQPVEISRRTVPLEAGRVPLGTISTGVDGEYSLELAYPTLDDLVVEAFYTGSDRYWPSFASAR